jgi:hypothetical protein
MSKVFSIVDFKEGLDVRKTPLTAPGGSLRILENAVLNQGGEIEKRLAFVYMTTVPGGAPETGGSPIMLTGQGSELHVFGFDAKTISAGSLPVPITYHQLASPPETMIRITDVEAFADKFYVCAQGASGYFYCWYNDVPVLEVDGSLSHGSYARTWRSKMYRIDGQYLRFSGVNDPANNDPASTTSPGAGFINMALNDPDGEQLAAMEVYYSQMAVQARLQTQLWSLDPDPTKDTLQQLLRIGNVAPRSTLQFGTGDVLFLSDSGVRSLRNAAFNTVAASVSDVGSAIDMLLIPLVQNPPYTYWANRAEAVIQPLQGRYWLGIYDTIFVLSYFPAGHITAWSTFKPGFAMLNFALVNDMVFVLDANANIYLYGGTDRNTYDSCPVTVRTPHLSADKPTENKRIQSIDVMCQGAWAINVGMLPNNTEAFELAANIQDNTFGLMSIPFAGYGTHFGVHMTHNAPGPAVMAALHFNLQEGVTK